MSTFKNLIVVLAFSFVFFAFSAKKAEGSVVKENKIAMVKKSVSTLLFFESPKLEYVFSNLSNENINLLCEDKEIYRGKNKNKALEIWIARGTTIYTDPDTGEYVVL